MGEDIWWLVFRCLVSRWPVLEEGRVLSSRPFTNHRVSPPEGLATRRSIRINGNYFARERDEWAAGRETSFFVVPSACHRAPGHTRARARSHAGARTHVDNRKALQLNNRPPVKHFFLTSHTRVRAHTLPQRGVGWEEVLRCAVSLRHN